MSIQYIRDYYHVPAKIGGRVRFKNNLTLEGKIVNTTGSYLKVRIDGENFLRIFHPTTVEYLDKCNLLLGK